MMVRNLLLAGASTQERTLTGQTGDRRDLCSWFKGYSEILFFQLYVLLGISELLFLLL